MFDNICNDISTNKFEALTGVLNIAPVKLSGIYKIFVDKNKVLFLDDYNGRRVKIDKSQKFLSQVANFLKTETTLNDTNKLRYGGFRYDTELTYHSPLYINNDIPKYFQISRVENKTITDSTDLHKYNDILLLVDLKQIGLYKIFEEINNTYDYLLNFNLEDSNLTINGFSINEETNVKKTIPILNSLSNQPYLSVFNNMILNTFKNNNIIFPKFINVEFEFEYVNNLIPFNNFFGCFSFGKEINISNFDNSISTISLLEYSNKIEFKQEKIVENISPIEFIDVVSVSNVIKPENKIPQIRVKINNISIGDYFRIIHPDGTVYFEYLITQNDIKATLRETLRYICNNATSNSGRNLIFTSDIKTNIITIKSNIVDLLIEEYYIEKINNFIFIDDTNLFCSILDSDIIINNENNANIYDSVLIDNIKYDVKKIFTFNGKIILRLNNFNNSLIENNIFIEIYENKLSKLIQLEPIPYLSVNSNLYAYEQFEKDKYIQNLSETFTNNISQIAQNKFQEINNFNDVTAYVDDVNNVLTSKEFIEEDTKNNSINILNMMFCSPGCTGLLTPNILNIDKRFYDYNNNLDYKLLDLDKIKFHWFLIKAKTPDYLLNDIRQLRYFTDKPKITSRLILSENNLDFCETIFLGVKYRLPQKYSNYQFATYLNFQENSGVELTYTFDVDNNEKTIYLCINKYLDFIDLIKGGVYENEPLIDLSFFYCVQDSHNTNSQELYAFKTGGLLLCDDTISVMYQNQIINDWKVFDSNTNKWYICLKRSRLIITPLLTEIFPDNGDINFYVYSSVTYDNLKHNYTSMLFTIKNIRDLKEDYLWCEDITVKFFDTPRFFMNIYNEEVVNKIVSVSKSNIINSVPSNPNSNFPNQDVISTIIVDSTLQQFKLINNNKIFSFKENYFELVRHNVYDYDNNYSQNNEYFYFPEYINNGFGFNELSNMFNIDSFDNVTLYSKITLFDRNQLWKILQDIIKYDVKFKHSTPRQTFNIIHELLLSQLNEYSNLNSIKINNPEPLNDEYIKLNVIENDVNVVIWQMYPEILSKTFIKKIPKIHKINRYNSPYLPYLRLLNNELDFQKDIVTNRSDVLFNIYDNNFNGTNIVATGNLKEVTGNIVSSLYTKNDEITFTIPYPDDSIDLILHLKNVIPLEEAIINNKNDNYISTINNNIDEYIKESYIKWLLLNTYKLDSVKNELGQKINFEIVSEINYIVKLNPKSFYHTTFKNVIFTFTRK